MHSFRREAGIDEGDALRLCLGEAEVALADFFIKFTGLALHAVQFTPGGVDALPSGGCIEVQQDGELGEGATGGEGVDGGDGGQRQSTGEALIDGGRVEEAVENDENAFSKHGADFFPDDLSPAGGEEEQLSLMRQALTFFGMLEQVADLLADGSATRLSEHNDAVACGFEMPLKHLDLRGLAATFRTFEGEQKTGRWRDVWHDKKWLTWAGERPF